MSTAAQQSVSELMKTQFFHLWEIRNFPEFDDENRLVVSSCFSPACSEEKWILKLKPRVIQLPTETEYIGLFLFLSSVPSEDVPQRRATYKMSFLRSNYEKYFEKQCEERSGRIFNAKGDGYGFNFLIERSVALKPENLCDFQSLRILVEIIVIGNIHNKTIEKNENDVVLYNSIELSIGSIGENFDTLFEKKKDADIIVRSCDGVEFQAHSIVLATRSEVFKSMLNESRIIELDGFCSPVVHDLLKFVYSDKLDMDSFPLNAYLLLEAAILYKIVSLQRNCEQQLCRSLNFDMIEYILRNPDVFKGTKLKQKAIEYYAAEMPTQIRRDYDIFPNKYK